MFILSGVIIVATIIANIVIREIRLGRDYQNALLTVFGAETTLEESLYLLRSQEAETSTLNGAGQFANGVSWERSAFDTADQRIFDFLENNEQITVNVYNRQNENDAGGAEAFAIEWKTGAFLDVDIWEWDGENLTNITSSPLSFPCTSVPCATATSSVFSADKAYQMNIKARGGDASDIVFKAFPSDAVSAGGEMLIPVPITISTTASLGGAKQAIQITIPQRLPWQ